MAEPARSTVAISSGQQQGRQHQFTRAELMSFIHTEAIRQGLGEDGARAAQAIAETEGGLSNMMGDVNRSTGSFSVGPFQFYYGGKGQPSGQLTNFAKQMTGGNVDAARDKILADPQTAIRWALSGYLGQAIKAGQQQGLKGPALATHAQAKGQVSVTPERAGENYQRLFGGSAPPAGGTMTTQPRGNTAPPSFGLGDQDTGAYLNPYIMTLTTQQEDLEKAYEAAVADAASEEATEFRISDATKAKLAQIAKRLQDTADALNQARLMVAKTGSPEARLGLEKQMLDLYRTRLAADVASGELSRTAADKAWDRAQQAATLGMTAQGQAYGAHARLLPMMGGRDLADAVVKSLNDFRGQGQWGKPPLDFKLPVVNVPDPFQAFGQYAPPAELPQQEWQKALGYAAETEPARQQALAEAMQTGQMTAEAAAQQQAEQDASQRMAQAELMRQQGAGPFGQPEAPGFSGANPLDAGYQVTPDYSGANPPEPGYQTAMAAPMQQAPMGTPTPSAAPSPFVPPPPTGTPTAVPPTSTPTPMGTPVATAAPMASTLAGMIPQQPGESDEQYNQRLLQEQARRAMQASSGSRAAW